MKINDANDPNQKKREILPISVNKELQVKRNFQISLEFSEQLVVMDFSFN
jgi:hypothetical protein